MRKDTQITILWLIIAGLMTILIHYDTEMLPIVIGWILILIPAKLSGLMDEPYKSKIIYEQDPNQSWFYWKIKSNLELEPETEWAVDYLVNKRKKSFEDEK
jgi:hypothetical protein